MLNVTGAFWQEALPSMLSTLQKHFGSNSSGLVELILYLILFVTKLKIPY